MNCARDFQKAIISTHVCVGCKKTFTDYASNGKRTYCSKQCKIKNQIIPKGKNSPRWNSTLTKCKNCGQNFYRWKSNKNKKYCSKKCYSEDLSGKYPKNLKGKRGIKPRTYHLRKRGKRGSVFDREWRIAVFERDNYICQRCNIRGGRLQAHHKKPYKEYPDLRYDLNNGETLCIDCHKNTETYGWSKYWHNKRRIIKERQQRKLF
jgi:endogenous inhibitor of DNA gyrase (YacG/DUF329 family)